MFESLRSISSFVRKMKTSVQYCHYVQYADRSHPRRKSFSRRSVKKKK